MEVEVAAVVLVMSVENEAVGVWLAELGVDVDQSIKRKRSGVTAVQLVAGSGEPVLKEADMRLSGARTCEQAAEWAVRRRRRRLAGAGGGEGAVRDGAAPAVGALVVRGAAGGGGAGAAAATVDRHCRSHNIAAGCRVRSRVSGSPYISEGSGEGEREASEEGQIEARLGAGERTD